MARKFKKKLALRQTRSKAAPILSVGLDGEEYKERLFGLWNKFISKAKRLRLSN